MRKEYEKLFTFLKAPELPEGLFDKVIHRIYVEKQRRALRWQFLLGSLGCIGSLIAFVPAITLVQTGFAESGFKKFFSLIFSDGGMVITYWQNFIFILLESLPIMSTVLLLAIAIVFFESFLYLFRNIKPAARSMYYNK